MFARLLSSFLFFISLPIWADQLIIEPDMGRQPILDAIDQAQQSVALVMYGFTDKELLNALIQKKEQGKSVNIILEDAPYKSEKENIKTIESLKKYNVKWQGRIKPFKLIHQKTLILDDKKAIVMTFNFTHSAFKNQRNFALVIDDAERVKDIASLFSADWNHIAHPNSHPDLIISPANSREKLFSLINDAKHSIKIYAQNIKDYKMVGDLARAARKSATVQIITSAHLKDKQIKYLQQAGVEIHYSKKLYIHAKVFIFDDQVAVIGSINLTNASLDENRELSVMTQDKNVLKQLNDTFASDWKNAKLSKSDDLQKLLPDKKHLQKLLKSIDKFVHSA